MNTWNKILSQLQFTLLLTLFFTGTLSLSAQGISFFDGTWSEALKTAEEERKLIFIDAYTTWCGPCKMMDRNVYSHSEVGDYYNEHFINVKMDMEKGEGLILARQYYVTTYPTLLYINHTGAQIYRDSAYKSPQQMMEIAQIAQDPSRNLELLELEFGSGDKDPDKVRDYAYLLKELGEDYRKPAGEYFATQSDKDLLKGKNWEAIKALTYDLNSREFKYLLKKEKKFYRKYGEEEVKTKISDVLKKSVVTAAILRDRSTYSDALKIALEELDDEGKTAQRLRMTYTAGTREWELYAQRAMDYFEKYPTSDAEELTEAANNFTKYVPEEQKLITALDWIRKANSIASTFERQYIQSGLLYKLGRWDEAMRYAYQSLNMARSGVGSETQVNQANELLNAIREAMK